MEGIVRCCQICKATCAANFKKIHTKKGNQSKGGVSKYDDIFMLQNTGGKQIKKPEYIGELHQFNTECPQCKKTVQVIRSLLEEIKTITENKVTDVCEHRKRAPSFNKTCKKCEFIVSEFKSMQEKRYKQRQQRFNVWLCKVNQLLQSIVNGEGMCKHRLNKDIEVERILNTLKEPLCIREPDIDSFSNLNQEKLTLLQSVSQTKEMLEELFSKMELKDEKTASSSRSPLPFIKMCLCKCLKKKQGRPTGLDLKPLKDFSKTLLQEEQEDLMKALLDMCRALPQEFHLNTELIKDIVETINKFLEEGLPQNIVFKLINNLTELNETITDDLSQDLNTKVTQALIGDLNDLLLLGSCKDLNSALIMFLVNLSNLLTHEICKGLINTEELRDKNIMPQKKPSHSSKAGVQKLVNLNKALNAGILDKNVLEELSSDIRKAIGQMPPDELNKTIKELTSLYKSAARGKSKTVNLDLIQGLINDARKALVVGLTKDQNKKIIYNRNKALNSNKSVVQKIPAGFTKNNVKKVLSAGYSTVKTTIKKTSGHADYKNKRLFNSEAGIAKFGTKSGKTALKKPLAALEKTKRKPGMERVNKADIGQFSFQNKDKSNTKNKPKKNTGVKGKENLPPGDDKKKKRNQFKERSKELETDARELSLSFLIKKQIKENQFKLKKQNLLAKQAEKERIKYQQMTLRDVTKQEKLIQTLSSRDEITSDQQTEITIFGEPPQSQKDLEKEVGVPEPLPTSPIARRSSKYQELVKNGTIKYELSNEAFIRKGWTVLPTEKIMRRMNVYRMEPASSRNCWFYRHKGQGELFYDSGQKLAEIDENGRGCWYYRNGNIALDYHDAQDSNVGQRYVVYSSGSEMEGGKIRPRTVLALFDGLGNCVVYDLFGKIRLKYNQSEGVLMDPKIGPPSKWKWHSLNDPPVLQRLLVDTCMEERDSNLERLYKTHMSHENEAAMQTHNEMVAIELDNFVKEKTFKLKQKFRPFKIRVKTVKLNQQFSLQIIDQATIYLFYRDGLTNLKLNLGMLLQSHDIIDSVNSDVGDVSTPYDVRPAMTESVENIHKILRSVRSCKP